MTDPTGRFSNRVADYIRWRPSYPPQVIELLRDAYGLTPTWVVADVGSGPGNLTRLFLDNGNPVFGVEPNQEMRQAGEELLSGYATFTSVDGSAEATGLPDACVDLVVAGQAFHWFDPARSRVELSRILRGDKLAALVWNERIKTDTPFAEGYEALLRRLTTDYATVHHGSELPEELAIFFGGPEAYEVTSFPSEQRFDREGLRGRYLSSSYTPAEGQPGHEAMLAELDELFDRTNEGGGVVFPYDTRVYVGRLPSP